MRLLIIFVSIWSVCVWQSPVHAQQVLKIGTGGIAGTYYPVGRVIAGLINRAAAACDTQSDCPLRGVVAVPELSAGTVANIENLERGLIQLALVQADQIGSDAQIPFSLVSAIYTEAVHVVVREEGAIRRLEDLAGHVVSLDEEGSGTRSTALTVLDAAGVSSQQFRSAFFKPEFAAERMATGELDAFFIVSGVPTGSVTDVSRRMSIRLLPIADATARFIVSRHPSMIPVTIPAGTYTGVPATRTVGVEAYLVARNDLDEALVETIMGLIWSSEGRRELIRAHAPIAGNTLDTATRNKALRVHPGVSRYLAGRSAPVD